MTECEHCLINTEIWTTLEQFIQILCSDSHNLVLSPKLQDHCLNKYTHFILSKKHVCDENSILCSPLCLAEQPFQQYYIAKEDKNMVRQKEGLRTGCREAIGRVRKNKGRLTVLDSERE